MSGKTFLASLVGGCSALLLGTGAVLSVQQSSAVRPADGESLTPAAIVNDAIGLIESRVFKLDVPNRADVDSSFAVNVPIEGTSRRLNLRLQSVRAEGYILRAQLADGSYSDITPGEINTFVGEVDGLPGSVVAAGLDHDGFTASIRMPDRTIYIVEPVAAHVNGSRRDEYVVFRNDDSTPVLGSCGTDHSGELSQADNGDIEQGTGNCGGACVAQIAFDADFEYYLARGSSIPNTENRINQIMNIVNTLYDNEADVRHTITAIIVRTAEPDPYSSSDSTTLLNQFRNHWLANQGAVQRDVAHLLTGRSITGTVIGQAFNIGVICTNQAYAYAQSDCCGFPNCAADLTAHELGHLWGCTHVSDGLTMNPSITCALNFTNSNVTQIVNERNSIAGACLDPFNPPPPPGAFNLVSPANGATGVAVNATLDWADSVGALTYTVVVDDDADFSTPLISLADLAVSQAVPAFEFVQGRTYFWRATAVNNTGSTNSNPVTGSFTTIRDCNGNGINDVVELANPANDCNNNGVLDACDLNGEFRFASDEQGPIFFGTNQSFNVPNTRDAVSNVSFRVRSQSDLNTAIETYAIRVNGAIMDVVFDGSFVDCALTQDNGSATAAAFNAARAGSPNITVLIEPSTGVGNIGCTQTYVSFEMWYNGTPTSLDGNGNNIPDECDGPAFALGDMNCDGIVSVGDISGFVLALTDPAGYAIAFPTCDINLADINQDSVVTVGDIAGFVALLTGG